MKIRWRIFLGIAAGLCLAAEALRHAALADVKGCAVLSLILYIPSYAACLLILGSINELLFQLLSWLQALFYAFLIASEFRRRRIALFLVFGIHGILVLVGIFLLTTYKT